MAKHVLIQHNPLCPDEDKCPICSWGAAICLVCGGTEGELPDECPGRRMTEVQRDQVMHGILDFKNGVWCKFERKVPA